MIRVFEAFAGYGSQSMALRNLGIDYEVVAISEIDSYVTKAYKAIHGDVLNLGDISQINVKDIPQHDLFTYSFPCQDISIAGFMKGIHKGKTRSGLLYECEKIIEHCKPKYLLMENVKNLVSNKFKSDFNNWLSYLESLGYTNYWEVLNAKDFGIPQNRERVFVVSILGEHKPYDFPKGYKLNYTLEDFLENNVDISFYINKERASSLLKTYNEDYLKKTDTSIKQVTKPNFSQQRIYDISGIAPTINAGNNGGGKEPCKIIIPPIYKEEYLDKITSVTFNKKSFDCMIRKLTPYECFRLMGLSDKDINNIMKENISNTQLYKMAGNSIVLNVLEDIFYNLFVL